MSKSTMSHAQLWSSNTQTCYKGLGKSKITRWSSVLIRRCHQYTICMQNSISLEKVSLGRAQEVRTAGDNWEGSRPNAMGFTSSCHSKEQRRHRSECWHEDGQPGYRERGTPKSDCWWPCWCPINTVTVFPNLTCIQATISYRWLQKADTSPHFQLTKVCEGTWCWISGTNSANEIFQQVISE